MEAGEHQVGIRGLRKDVIDWIQLERPIEAAPGSHLIFFSLRPPSSVQEGNHETVGHPVDGDGFRETITWPRSTGRCDGGRPGEAFKSIHH